MKRHFYFFRHGQSNENQSGIQYGVGGDAWLTEKGIAQAENLGEYLRDKKIQVVYSSPFKRAVDTAKIATKNYPYVDILTEDDLKEAAFGFWCEDDERIANNFKRIKECLMRIVKNDKHENIAISSHGGVSRALCWACGYKVEGIKNCECFHFVLEDEKWQFIERYDTGIDVQNKSDI